MIKSEVYKTIFKTYKYYLLFHYQSISLTPSFHQRKSEDDKEIYPIKNPNYKEFCPTTFIDSIKKSYNTI